MYIYIYVYICIYICIYINIYKYIYCRVSYVRGELIFAYFAVPYMREIKVPRKNQPKTLFRT